MADDAMAREVQIHPGNRSWRNEDASENPGAHTSANLLIGSVRRRGTDTHDQKRGPVRAEHTEVPRVHFHVDWRLVRWVRIRRRRLELIDSEFEVVFCADCDLGSRIFWFYLRDSAAVQFLRNKWGDGWIDLMSLQSRSTVPSERATDMSLRRKKPGPSKSQLAGMSLTQPRLENSS